MLSYIIVRPVASQIYKLDYTYKRHVLFAPPTNVIEQHSSVLCICLLPVLILIVIYWKFTICYTQERASDCAELHNVI